MDDDKLHKAITAGDKAQAMLSGGKIEPLAFKEACELLSKELMTAWKTSRSTEDRERIWSSINLLEKIEDTLSIVASNGRVAKSDLENLTRKR